MEKKLQHVLNKKVILVICILLGLVVCVLPLLLFREASLWANNADVEGNRAEFDVIAELLMDEYGDEDEKKLIFGYKPEEGRSYLYDYSEEIYVELTAEQQAALEAVAEAAANDGTFDSVTVAKDRVTFHTADGSYALVYSVKNKPKYGNSPDEDARIHIRAAGGDWYHIAVR